MPDKAADAKPSDSPGKILQEACKITRSKNSIKQLWARSSERIPYLPQ